MTPRPWQREDPSASCLDTEYQPSENELLFWLGYPGSTATRHESVTEANTRYSWFGSLETLAVPVVSQQLIDWPDGLPDDYRPDSHILVHYPANGQRGRGAPDTEAPNPHGMSSSFLWDTKRVACWRSGKEWSPEYARVCGIVWGTFANPDVIVATPVQQLRSLIDATAA